MTSIVLSDGWVRHQWLPTRDDYWLDPFLPGSTREERSELRLSVVKRVSPIRGYDSRGIGPVEWINTLHDRAVILDADGGWAAGGEFHVWYSRGAGMIPCEITKSAVRGPIVVAGDNAGWEAQLEDAIAQVEAYVGIVSCAVDSLVG